MRWIVLVSSGLALAACGTSPLDDFRNRLPQEQIVQDFAAPSSASSQPGQSQQGLSSLQAASFLTTMKTIHDVAGIPVGVFKLLHALSRYSPTHFDGETAVWGPANDDAKGTTWRATVSRSDGVNYQYRFEAKAKGEADSSYLTLLSGHPQRSAG